MDDLARLAVALLARDPAVLVMRFVNREAVRRVAVALGERGCVQEARRACVGACALRFAATCFSERVVLTRSTCEYNNNIFVFP